MATFSPTIATRIAALFEGFDGAHGRYEVKRVNDRGKNEGRATTIKGPASEALWEAHLRGEGAGLGVIPLRSDDMVMWGCIDIDVIGIDHAQLEDACRKLALPLVICRSKSGGAHAFLFLNAPVAASAVVPKLESFAAALGHGGCEIFPKQTSRFDPEKDIGNWLNMPYFYANRTNRYGVHDGKELSVEEFLDFAESMRVDAAALQRLQPLASALDEGLLDEGPPCLQMLHASGGFPEGTRNDGMYNVAVYLKKRFPDDWQNHLTKYGSAMCDPALPLAEMNAIAKSVGKVDYQFRCSKAPIAPYCNRRLCVTRKFGIGESGPEIEHLVKYEGDPVLWFATIAGRRVMFATDELVNQNKFKIKVFGAIQRMPMAMKPDKWNRYIDELGKNCEVIDVPEEATDFGRFKLVLESYLLGQARTTSREQLAMSNSPFLVGDGTVMFKLQGLLKHLDVQGFKHTSTAVCKWLRELGADNSEVHVRKKVFNVWVMAEPIRPEPLRERPTFGTEEF